MSASLRDSQVVIALDAIIQTLQSCEQEESVIRRTFCKTNRRQIMKLCASCVIRLEEERERVREQKGR